MMNDDDLALLILDYFESGAAREDREAMMKERKLIGSIGVDAGLCWLGDPCYFWPDPDEMRAPAAVKEIGDTWHKFCSKLSRKEQFTAFGTLGVVVNTGIGDGIYPVYATIEDGMIASVTVEFLSEEEEEEDEEQAERDEEWSDQDGRFITPAIDLDAHNEQVLDEIYGKEAL